MIILLLLLCFCLSFILLFTFVLGQLPHTARVVYVWRSGPDRCWLTRPANHGFVCVTSKVGSPCATRARGLGYLLSGAVLACMFIFFGLVVGVDSSALTHPLFSLCLLCARVCVSSIADRQPLCVSGLFAGWCAAMRAGKVVIFLLSVSDALIALSYFFIPGAMFAVVLMRKVVLPLRAGCLHSFC